MTSASSKSPEKPRFGIAGEKPVHDASFGTKCDAGSAASKTVPNGEKTLYRAEFLAQMPPAIHAFAAQRLASAKAEKLRSMKLQRESDELSQEERERTERVGGHRLIRSK